MVNLNLLPWRAQRRKKQQQEFIILLSGVLGLCVALLFSVHIFMGQMTAAQQDRNDYLLQQMHHIDATIKEIEALDQTRDALVERMDVIQKLQQARPSIVYLFDEIARTVPSNLHLVELKQDGENVELNGMAESNASISTYMLNIENSHWLTAPALSIISSHEDAPNRQRHFSLSLTQRSIPSISPKSTVSVE